MGGFEVLALFLVLVAFVVGIRLAMDPMDRQRITNHIEDQGGRVLNITWSPFGTGWFGEKSQRIYEVEYEDAASERHKAFCKTSVLTGVYWTEDRIIGARRRATDNDETAQLRRENARLRAEIERLHRRS